jgi:ATP-dependent helicase/DNAse subunit B
MLGEQNSLRAGFGAAVWLAPTKHAAAEIRGQLLAGDFPGCFSPSIYTFDQFVHTLLANLEFQPRFLGPLLKRQLIENVLAKANAAGQLTYFSPILETAGLVDLLASFISDLKRQEVPPAKFSKLIESIEAIGSREKNRELALIYAEYQQLLKEHQLLDLEERFAAAGEFLQAQPPEAWGALGRLQCLVIDGFTDFTAAQLEILQLLVTKSKSLSEVTISLPMEHESGRDDLFDKPRATLAQLKSRFPRLKTEWQPRTEHAIWPGLDHIERHVFENPKHGQPAADTLGIEILSAAGQLAEIELLARRIKELLMFGYRTESKRAAPALAAAPKMPITPATKVAPADIAVVFRTVDPLSALVEEVFTEYGIPLAIESPPLLGRSPALRALVGVLQLAANDWPFRQLLALLANNFFQPAWPDWQQGEAAIAAEWAIRQLQIPKGQTVLLIALRRRAEADDPAENTTPDGDPLDEIDQKRQQEHRQRYRLAAAIVGRLADALGPLNRTRSLSDWIGVLDHLVTEIGIINAIGSKSSEWVAGVDQREPPAAHQLGARRHSPPATPRKSKPENLPDDLNSAPDIAAWQHLKDTLAAAIQLEEQWLHAEPMEIPLSQLIRKLQEILAVEPLPAVRDDTGKVRVMSAQSIRALNVPYLFVAGLTEKSFPLPARDDRVYTEPESRAFDKLGLRFASPHERSSEEMLLFYEVVTRATRRLVLSYPALDEKAQPLLASPYLQELKRACGPGQIEQTADLSLRPVPQHTDAYSPAEKRVIAVDQLMQDNTAKLQSLLQTDARSNLQTSSQNELNVSSAGNSIVSGLLAVALRAKNEGFSQFEGMLTSDAAKAALTARYGPQHCWSVSRLEEYAKCPFEFYSRQVLGLEELPELSLTVDYRRRGYRTHEALAAMHRKLNAAGQPKSPASLDEAEFAALKTGTLAILFEHLPKGSDLDRALQEIDFQLIGKWLDAYLVQHQSYDDVHAAANSGVQPAHFEVSFGLKRRGADKLDSLSTEKPFELKCGDETVRLSGRIDRIDVGLVGDQIVFNVLDYKTGSKRGFKQAEIEAGLALQLPLYALAVQDLLLVDRRAMPWRVGYWYLKEKGFDAEKLPQLFEQVSGDLRETAAWNELRGILLSRVVQLVRGIRGGEFPVFSQDDNCTSHCSYGTLCRIGQIRALNKLWISPPPEVIAQLEVKSK